MSRSILVTGATGKQGGALIHHLLSKSNNNQKFTILAVTRDPNSPSALRLASKSTSIKLVKGNLDSPSDLFSQAKAVAPDNKIWGVFSVQSVAMREKHRTEDEIKHSTEVKQGIGMIDESLKNDVEHFVYSSVDRGGEELSWNNPTPVPHFKTKHYIEQHLLKSTAESKMSWTILRPVIFMDNLVPGFGTKVFLTALRDTMGTKTMSWISCYDIGFFASQAFQQPQDVEYKNNALTLSSDQFNFTEMQEIFKRATGGKETGTTFSFLGSALKFGVKEMGIMIDWFKTDGYEKSNADKLRKLNPDLMDLETWLKTKSDFVKRT